MICENCAAGGDLTARPAPTIAATRVLAVEAHGRCQGSTWCDCQCEVPSVEVLAARREAMPRGGLARIVGNVAGGAGGCG